jgi:hypothetical protein
MHDMNARLNFGNGNAEFVNPEIQEAHEAQEGQLGEELIRCAPLISELEAALAGRATICEQLTKELSARATRLSGLEVNLTNLQAELSERTTETVLLKGKIDSIHSSICWRLTWSIRWLHTQIKRIEHKWRTVHFSQKIARRIFDRSALQDYFSETFYLGQNPGLATTGVKPLQHYLDAGWKEGLSPHPLFDVRWYLERNQDVRAAGVEPLEHYLHYGWKEGRSPHPLFDGKWYLSQNPAVSASGIEPLMHYLGDGWKEQRDPHPLFCVRRYLQENPDVRESGIEPLTHYLLGKVNDSPVFPLPDVTDAIDAATLLRSRFPNLAPIRLYSAAERQPRVNMIADSLSEGSLFGGVGTAIVFSVLLAEKWDCPLRIITRTQQPEPRNVKEVLVANNIDWKKNIEFLFDHIGDHQAHVDVSSEDVFVTTSWWTTWSTVQSIRSDRIIYLLQEDERMFYPEGDEKLRCQETISNPEIHLVVNSYLLYRHLVDDGFRSIEERALWFEPSIIDNASDGHPATEVGQKSNFFFYAHPGGNSRSLFCLGLEVIEKALVDGILDANYWNFFFVGRDLARIKLTGNVEPALIQNIKWSQYRRLVNSMDLGLSLMSTPHPSYPTLDLAASGAVVVTNTFGVKTNLDSYSANIICASPTIAGLTNALQKAMPLVYDPIRRQQNRAADQILRDWRTSFEKTLDRLSRDKWKNPSEAIG